MSPLGPSRIPLKVEENSSRISQERLQSLQYPATPRLSAKQLPPHDQEVPEQDQAIALTNIAQILPECLIFQDEVLSRVDARIAFQERNRCVAQPTITFMPEYPGYLWGAVTSHIETRDDGLRVHFEEVMEPATNPAVTRMRIATGFGDTPKQWLEVLRREDVPYIMVADVQRTVIDWMNGARLTRPRSPSSKLTSWVTLVDEDEKEFEFETWIWRGLVPLDDSMENWGLKFADDAAV